jgi:hypothetical protein
MTTKLTDKMMGIGLIICLIYGLILGTISLFKPERNETITFNVTGIVNATNSSIISLQAECVKLCINKQDSMEGYEEDRCFSACAKIGGCVK